MEITFETKHSETVTMIFSAHARFDLNGAPIGLMAVGQDITEHIQIEKQRKTFVASFSHELRTPLAGIMGMLELLSNMRLEEQALEYTHKAAVSANLLLNLVNDILGKT
jgi:signal transduction histidine kinase